MFTYISTPLLSAMAVSHQTITVFLKKKLTTMLYSLRVICWVIFTSPNIRSQSLLYVEVRMISYHMLCISELVSPFP